MNKWLIAVIVGITIGAVEIDPAEYFTSINEHGQRYVRFSVGGDV